MKKTKESTTTGTTNNATATNGSKDVTTSDNMDNNKAVIPKKTIGGFKDSTIIVVPAKALQGVKDNTKAVISKKTTGSGKDINKTADPKKARGSCKDNIKAVDPTKTSGSCKDKTKTVDPRKTTGSCEDNTKAFDPKKSTGSCKDNTKVLDPKKTTGSCKENTKAADPKKATGSCKDNTKAVDPKKTTGSCKDNTKAVNPKKAAGSFKGNTKVFDPRKTTGSCEDNTKAVDPKKTTDSCKDNTKAADPRKTTSSCKDNTKAVNPKKTSGSCKANTKTVPPMKFTKSCKDSKDITKNVVHNTIERKMPDAELNDVLKLLENITLDEWMPSHVLETTSKQAAENNDSKNSTSVNDANKIVEKFSFCTYSKPDHKDLDLNQLIDLVNKIEIKHDADDSQCIEELTQDQTKSHEWHRLRTGRITASVFKSACRTTVRSPSKTVVEKICSPEKVQFYSKSVAYGRKYESIAFEEFSDLMQLSHANFKCRTNGLIICEDYPYFGASPDGMCSCDCCGESCLEIKCPFTLRDGAGIEALLKLKDPFLVKTNDKYELSKKHSYYYQVQMQIFVCKVEFCYFFIWSENESLCIKVLKDCEFWEENSKKAIEFSKQVILPEVLGQYYSRKVNIS